MEKKYISIDVGGTHIKYGLLTQVGDIVELGKASTPKTKSLFSAEIDRIIQYYADQIEGVAFSLPGRVDSDTGRISFGGSLPYLHEFNVVEYVKKQCELPASVINDGKAAVLAEWWQGNLEGAQNGLALILGTGVGGGIIADGRLLQGHHFQAGELSFMVQPSQNLTENSCYGRCGSAVKMIERMARHLGLSDLHDGIGVFRALKEDKKGAYTIFEEYCRDIAILIYNVQSVLDMQRVVIGGGISRQPIVIQEIQRQYLKILPRLGIVQPMVTPVEIQECAFHNEANLIGALYHYLHIQKN